jgi:hypothetical protein
LIFIPQNLATQQEIWGVNGGLSLRTGGIPGSANATERVSVTSAGNVGIGTSSPSQKLDVAGTVKMTGFNLSTTPTAGYVLTADGTGNGTWQAPSGTVGGTGSANYLAKFTGASTVTSSAVFESGGNVGIGTTTPAYKLDVNGIINATQVLRNGTSGPSLVEDTAATFTINSPTFVNTGYEVSLSLGSAQNVHFTFNGMIYNNSGSFAEIILALQVDSGTEVPVMFVGARSGDPFWYSAAFSYYLQVPAGTHTVRLRARKDLSGVTEIQTLDGITKFQAAYY